MKLRRFALPWLAIATTSLLHAQRATELFIPIGESPAVSGEETVIGTIETVDASERTIVVRSEGSGDLHTASIVEGTEIYLDRSKLREKNAYGTVDDLTEGARIEMLYADAEGSGATGSLRWIKVEISTPP